MRYCLDTSIIVALFRGDKALQEKIAKIDQRHICVTPVALAELFKGAYLSHQPSETLALIDDFTLNTEQLDFSEEACRLFGEKYADLAAQGRMTQQHDLMIGAIALAHNAALITRNAKDVVNIKGLHVLTW